MAESSKLRKRRLDAAKLKGTHTDDEWQLMKEYFNNTCVRCAGASGLIKVGKDHIMPLYQGGSDSIKNIQPLCARCNSSKGSENIDHRINFCEAMGIDMPTGWL